MASKCLFCGRCRANCTCEVRPNQRPSYSYDERTRQDNVKRDARMRQRLDNLQASLDKAAFQVKVIMHELDCLRREKGALLSVLMSKGGYPVRVNRRTGQVEEQINGTWYLWGEEND